MTVEIAKALGNMSNKINDLGKRLDDMMVLLNEQRAADIDYIAMETGVEMEQEGGKE